MQVEYNRRMIPRAELAVPLCFALLVLAAPTSADLPSEEVGRVLRLPDVVSDHWVWV
jgi:hypothetical protein